MIKIFTYLPPLISYMDILHTHIAHNLLSGGEDIQGSCKREQEQQERALHHPDYLSTLKTEQKRRWRNELYIIYVCRWALAAPATEICLYWTSCQQNLIRSLKTGSYLGHQCVVLENTKAVDFSAPDQVWHQLGTTACTNMDFFEEFFLWVMEGGTINPKNWIADFWCS